MVKRDESAIFAWMKLKRWRRMYFVLEQPWNIYSYDYLVSSFRQKFQMLMSASKLAVEVDNNPDLFVIS